MQTRALRNKNFDNVSISCFPSRNISWKGNRFPLKTNGGESISPDALTHGMTLNQLLLKNSASLTSMLACTHKNRLCFAISHELRPRAAGFVQIPYPIGIKSKLFDNLLQRTKSRLE